MTYPSCPMGIKLFTYTNSPRHLRAPIRFSTNFFHHPSERVKKVAHAHLHSVPQLLSVSFLLLDYSLYCSAGVLFCPLTSMHVYLTPLIFMFLSFSVPSCTLFGIYPPHLITNRQSLSIGLSFWSSFLVRCSISFSPIIKSFSAPQIFFIYHENTKNIVHLPLRFICTRILY